MTVQRVVKCSQTLAADSLPSVCFYSVMNSGVSVSAIETSDDSSLLAIGFTNSHIKVKTCEKRRMIGCVSSPLQLEAVSSNLLSPFFCTGFGKS